jgi:hypothetical protein
MTARDRELNAMMQRWLFAGMAVVTALGFGLVGRDYATAGGRMLVYWIEDAYIHLAMARTLLETGVWGVSSHGFANASSSPVWVVLLSAAMSIAGPDVRMALLLNILAALALFAIVARVLGHGAVNNEARAFAGVGASVVVLIVAPIPLMLSGMEHLGHAAAMLLAVWWLTRRLSDDGQKRGTGLLLPLLLILPLWRYESLWLHVLGAALAFARGERRFALTIALAGAIPIVGFGLFANAHDWPFLPAPILTKTVYLVTAPESWGSWLAWPLKYFLWWPLKRLLLYVPELLALMVAADCWLAWSLWRDIEAWRRQRWLAVLLFLLGSWTHATFASFGWGGRYEAYLLVLGVVTLAAALPTTDWRALAERRWRLAITGVLLACTAFAGALRAWHQHRDIPGRAELVALRDVWPAQVVGKMCGNARRCDLSVMAMNIGALSWYAGPRLTDLLALADREALELVRLGKLDNRAVKNLADERAVDVALIFNDWYGHSVDRRGPPLDHVVTLIPSGDRSMALSLYARDHAAGRRIAFALRDPPLPKPRRLDIRFDTSRSY